MPNATRLLTAILIAGTCASAASQNRSDADSFVRRAIVALHTFEYEDANDAFLDAQRADPGAAMAYWGEAMTYHQTLWRNEDIAAGRRALDRFAPTPAERAQRARKPVERDLLAAVEGLFGEGDAATRRRTYADAMADVYAKHRDDPDVAAFYALALLGTMSRSLIGRDDGHEGHVPGIAGSETQARVGAILDAVLKAHPEHLGALHYQLHNYDDPEHARLGLQAARTLTRLAPDSSHARHMPAHIFLQLGMWREAAAADRSAFDASTAWIARRGLPPTVRNYHALAWLQYSLLQRGRYRDAWATLGELEPVVKSSGLLPLLSDLSSMRARYAIETRQWKLMAGEQNFANVNDLFAIGMSAARTKNLNAAETVRRALADRSRDPREGDLRPAIAIMERELAALVAEVSGRRTEAIQILRAAADAERQLPPPLGLPAPVKPAPELLGELLLEAGRPREAVAPFEETLRRHRNRSLSLLGLARAASAAGNVSVARSRYGELLANYDEADGDIPELAEARKAIGRP